MAAKENSKPGFEAQPERRSTPRQEIKPSYSRNAFWNDYKGRRIYMYTFRMAKGFPPLSRIVGNPAAGRGENDAPRAEYTEIGRKIHFTINEVIASYPQIGICRMILMPDHIHLVIFVKEEIDRHVGRVIGHIKTLCSSRLKEAATVRSENPHGNKESLSIFDGKPQHTILKGKDQLERMIRYVEDNPRRLLIKRSNPELFRIRRGVEICGRLFAVLGNIFLLRKPSIMPVRVRRRFTDTEAAEYREKCLESARGGTVLVSPFISAKEKEIQRLALEAGANIIIIRKEGIPPLFKPPGKLFDLCSEGRLLYLAPWEYETRKSDLTRSECVEMNEIAEAIAGEELVLRLKGR